MLALTEWLIQQTEGSVPKQNTSPPAAERTAPSGSPVQNANLKWKQGRRGERQRRARARWRDGLAIFRVTAHHPLRRARRARDRGRTLLDNIKENFCETDLAGRSKQIQVLPIVGDAPRIRHLCLHAERPPIDQVDSHFPHIWLERGSGLHVPCTFLDGGHLPPKPLRKGPNKSKLVELLSAWCR
jgi:hypothetical protein